MRDWKRLTVPTMCGGCGAILLEGAVVQVLTLPNIQRRLTRCETCAEGSCPPVLASAPVTSGTLRDRMDAIGKLAVQFQRPAKPQRAVPIKQRAYRGEPAVQPDMLGQLPRRFR